MRKTKWFASMFLAVGMLAAGTTAASAQDWRDVRHDYNRVDRLRATIARDRVQLAKSVRFGNRFQIMRDRATLERHEAELRAQLRDVRWDTRDRDRNDYRR